MQVRNCAVYRRYCIKLDGIMCGCVEASCRWPGSRNAVSYEVGRTAQQRSCTHQIALTTLYYLYALYALNLTTTRNGRLSL